MRAKMGYLRQCIDELGAWKWLGSCKLEAWLHRLCSSRKARKRLEKVKL